MKRDSSFVVNCGCALLLLVFNILAGGWSVNYLLGFFLEKTIPFFWAATIGLFVGEISFPAAVVVAILHSFGIV